MCVCVCVVCARAWERDRETETQAQRDRYHHVKLRKAGWRKVETEVKESKWAAQKTQLTLMSLLSKFAVQPGRCPEPGDCTDYWHWENSALFSTFGHDVGGTHFERLPFESAASGVKCPCIIQFMESSRKGQALIHLLFAWRASLTPADEYQILLFWAQELVERCRSSCYSPSELLPRP